MTFPFYLSGRHHSNRPHSSKSKLRLPDWDSKFAHPVKSTSSWHPAPSSPLITVLLLVRIPVSLWAYVLPTHLSSELSPFYQWGNWFSRSWTSSWQLDSSLAYIPASHPCATNAIIFKNTKLIHTWRFLHFRTMNILGWRILCCGNLPSALWGL